MDATNLGRELARRRWSKPQNVEQRVDKLARHIRELVDGAPTLTAEQRARLAALLVPPPAEPFVPVDVPRPRKPVVKAVIKATRSKASS